MNRFWDLLIRPALEAAGARKIVEIGSEGGKHTQRLLEWCSSRAGCLHVIEPSPAYDAEELKASFPSALVFHCATSLEILDELGPIDAVLIDGDHNWYTVYHELKALERVNGSRFPLIFLHDVAWPFARRDMYYAPARIPAEYRHEYRSGGLRRGQSELLPAEEPGLVPELYKAVVEGGPRNGVLTAVEDFMRESSLDLRLEKVPVGFGLGIVASEALQARRPALRALLDEFSTHDFAWRIATHTEERRIDELVEIRHEYGLMRMHLAFVTEELGRHQAELTRHQHEVERLREMLGGAYGHAQALERHVEELRDRLGEQDQLSQELRGQLAQRDTLLVQHQTELARRDTLLVQHQTELAQRETKLGQQQAQLAQLEAALSQHQTQLAQLEAEIVAMRSSRSWRLTAPLRRISTRIKGRKQSQ